MSLRCKIRREHFEPNRVIFAERADLTHSEVYDLEESGRYTERVKRKYLNELARCSHHGFTENEEKRLLSEPFNPVVAQVDEEKAKKERPAREERKERTREEILTAQRLREM